MRDRLTALIEKADETVCGFSIDGDIGILADHILADGWVRLPCKVGQTVYVPWRYGGQRGVAVVKIKEIKLCDTDSSHFMFFIDMESDNECFNLSFGGWKTEKCIGKTVFLTREEAEKALAERSGE